MLKHRWLIITILPLLLCFPLRAQRYYDQLTKPDSIEQTYVLNCIRALDLFTQGFPDSLFAKLGRDTSIVHPDTLKKYSNLHRSSYNYANEDGKNPCKWISSPTRFYDRRMYVGNADTTIGDSLICKKALVLTAEMSWKDGKVVITKIRFSFASVTKELYDVLIVPRANKPFNSGKVLKEISRDMEDYKVPADKLPESPQPIYNGTPPK